MSQPSGEITTPEIVLYGPDEKYGAVRKKSFKSYIYYLVWYEGGQKRERTTKARFPDRIKAEDALREALEERKEHRDAPAGGYRPHQTNVGFVLEKYSVEYAVDKPAFESIKHGVAAMWPFWHDKLLSEVGEPTCKDYVKWRVRQETMHSREAREAWERRQAIAAEIAQTPIPAWSKRAGNRAEFLKRRAQMKAWNFRKAAIARLPDPERAVAEEALGAPPWEAAPPPKGKTRPPAGEPPSVEFVSQGRARTELEYLRAAIHYCRRRLYITEAPPVTLPEKSDARGVWLTRTEFAKMLLAARKPVPGHPHLRRHLIVYLKVGLYHAARKTAILDLPLIQPIGGGAWLDADRGIIDFGPGTGKKKRARHAKIHSRILVYLRGAQRRGQRYLIEMTKTKTVETPEGHIVKLESAPIVDVRHSFADCVERAGIDKHVTPHTLRHTGISWLKQHGVKNQDVSDYVGVSEAMIVDVYAHLDPDHQKNVIAAMTSGRRK